MGVALVRLAPFITAVASPSAGSSTATSAGPCLGRLLVQRDRGVRRWAKLGYDDVAGCVCWLAADYLGWDGNRSRARSTVDLAAQLGLATSEPRLALVHAQALTTGAASPKPTPSSS